MLNGMGKNERNVPMVPAFKSRNREQRVNHEVRRVP